MRNCSVCVLEIDDEIDDELLSFLLEIDDEIDDELPNMCARDK